MYRLRYVPEKNEYQIHSKGFGAFAGPGRIIMRKAMEMGIGPHELSIALSEMDKYSHNVAEFGIFGGFLYTKKN